MVNNKIISINEKSTHIMIMVFIIIVIVIIGVIINKIVHLVNIIFIMYFVN